jgi:hypothetical protein
MQLLSAQPGHGRILTLYLEETVQRGLLSRRGSASTPQDDFSIATSQSVALHATLASPYG